MFVRIATFEGGDTQRLQEIRREEGGLNLPEVVTRTMLLDCGERRLFVAFAESREDLESSEEQFNDMGDHIPDEIRGTRVSVDVYEVVSDEAVGGSDSRVGFGGGQAG